jgi:tetratricopeptide (TPR) repeat protein
MPDVFKATGRDTRKTKDETIVLPSTWAEAYFLKSYALVEQKDVEGAQNCLKKALHLSPCNATYWAELGHCHQLLRNWGQCLKAYQLAEEAADFSGDYEDQDKARAWRGIAFVYIETGKLDEATELYKK